jgi:endonuclease/exonuclease/phosphatase (EEP) superfamily protein YafD
MDTTPQAPFPLRKTKPVSEEGALVGADLLNPHWWRKRFGAAARYCAYAMAALTILGMAGAFWPLADLVNNFAPLWAGLAILGGLLALLTRGPSRWRALGVFATALAWNIWLIAPEYMRRSPAATATAPPVRIIALNVFGFRPTLQPTLNYLRRTPADFVVLSEVDRADRNALEALRGVYPYFTRCQSAPGCQTLILSRWPPLTEGETPLLATRDLGLDSSPRWAAATYEIGGAPVRLIGVHLASFRYADRRQEELAALARTARAAPAGLIIAGDFNATPWSFTLRRFHEQSGLSPQTPPIASWPSPIPNTYGLPAPFPYLAIDHVYAGAGWRLTAFERGPPTSSDHFPVVARLEKQMVNGLYK